jgi:SAM-dependent methyltransferase
VFGLGAALIRCLGFGLKFYNRTIMPFAEATDTTPAHAIAEHAIAFGSMDNLDPAQTERVRTVRRTYYNGIVDSLERLVRPLRTLRVVYEVGFNVGDFLVTAQARGLRPVGCEVNQRGVELAQARGLGLVQHALFQQALVPPGIDAFVCSDVLEHTPTPRADLERMFRALRVGGVLAVKTFYDDWHAGRALDLSPSGMHKPWPSHGYFDPVQHLYHFDAEVLRTLLRRIGFAIVEEYLDQEWGQIALYGRKEA